MDALDALLCEDIIQDGWQMYMANIGYGLIQGLARGKASLKPWGEIVNGKHAEPEKSGDDIFAEICAKALNRGEE